MPWVPQILISDYAAVLAVLVVAWALVDARPLAGLAVYALVATAATTLVQLRYQAVGISLWTLFGWRPLLPALAGLLTLPLTGLASAPAISAVAAVPLAGVHARGKGDLPAAGRRVHQLHVTG